MSRLAALVLPDGWERHADGHVYQVDPGGDAAFVRACLSGVEPDASGNIYTIEPDEARALAARLVEAAAIVEALRAGAR